MITRARAVAAVAAVAASVLLLVVATAAPADAAPAPAHPSVTLTMHVGTTLATAGTATYSGTVTKVPVGTAVYLEHREAAGRWATVAVTRTVAHGAFSDRYISDLAGRSTFRARVHAAARWAAASSATRTVTMSRFFSLSTVKPVSFSSIATRPVVLGVNTYPHAIVFLANATAGERSTEQWRVAGRCSLITAQVAYANAAQVGSSARGDAAIAVDGATASTAVVLSSDAPTTMSAPLRGATTVRLTVTFAGKDEASRIAWLEPRVLCTADPGGA